MWYLKCSGREVKLDDGTYIIDPYPNNIMLEKKESVVRGEYKCALSCPLGVICDSPCPASLRRFCEFDVRGDIVRSSSFYNNSSIPIGKNYTTLLTQEIDGEPAKPGEEVPRREKIHAPLEFIYK
ncbi:MAG: hypothetical protein AABW79_02140 [Nanoarchaeota archaeon]